MSNKAVSVYADALKRQQQTETQHSPQLPKVPQEGESTQLNTQPSTQKSTQLSNRPNELPSTSVSTLPDAQQIEELSFRLRKVPKIRVNADVPIPWKERLDEKAYALKVGKYELLVYIIGNFLGETPTD